MTVKEEADSQPKFDMKDPLNRALGQFYLLSCCIYKGLFCAEASLSISNPCSLYMSCNLAISATASANSAIINYPIGPLLCSV